MRENSFLVRFLTETAHQIRELLAIYADLLKIEIKETTVRALAQFFLMFTLLGIFSFILLFGSLALAFFISDFWNIPRYVGFFVLTVLFILFLFLIIRNRWAFRAFIEELTEKIMFEEHESAD